MTDSTVVSEVIGGDVLEQVATPAEAAAIVGYSQKHVILLCDTGRIRARKSAGGWIVLVKSLVQYAYREGGR